MLVYLIVLSQRPRMETATDLFVRCGKSGFSPVILKSAGSIVDGIVNIF